MKKNLLLSSLILFSSSSINAQLSNSNDVPVRISYVEAERRGNDNQLDWAVTCFLQFANFEIQRSNDGNNYTTINTFQADELRCRQPFSFTDANRTGPSYYRVRVGDIDGRFYSSKIVVLYGTSKGFDINLVTPTIITSQATLNISSATDGFAELLITGIDGQTVHRSRHGLYKNNNTIILSVANLQRGLYYITAVNNEGIKKTVSIVKG
jgi:hypothetical protein